MPFSRCGRRAPIREGAAAPFVSKLPAYYLSGQFEKVEVLFSLQFTPLVLGGALFGRWINQRMSDRLFSKLTYVLTFALGWYVLIDGIGRLGAR